MAADGTIEIGLRRRWWLRLAWPLLLACVWCAARCVPHAILRRVDWDLVFKRLAGIIVRHGFVLLINGKPTAMSGAG